MSQRRFWTLAVTIPTALGALLWMSNPDLGIAGVLLALLQVALLANIPVAVILWLAVYQGRGKKDGPALIVMAVLTTLVAVALLAYVAAVVNAGLDYIVPREAAQIVLRSVLLGLALFPLWFLWLFLTGRFRPQ